METQTTYTTKSGSVLTIENGKLRVALANGKRVEIMLAATIDPPAKAIEALRKAGCDPKDYRTLVYLNLDLEAAAWVDAQYETYCAAAAAECQVAAEALRRNVPGLDELRAAIEDEERYSEQFERMMEREDNDGARPPRPVKTAAADIAAQYPIAAAYITAENFENAAHYAKALAGRKAKARIAAGEDYRIALAEMEAEWDAHVQEHVWD